MLRLFRWIFRGELIELKKQTQKCNDSAAVCDSYVTHIQNILSNMDVSVDVHEYDHQYSPSWAVVSLQGVKTDYIKFMNLGSRDIRAISSFLHAFEKTRNIKVDATPLCSKFLKMNQ